LSHKRYDGGMAITGAGITVIGVGTTGIGVGATVTGAGIIAGTATIGATGKIGASARSRLTQMGTPFTSTSYNSELLGWAKLLTLSTSARRFIVSEPKCNTSRQLKLAQQAALGEPGDTDVG